MKRFALLGGYLAFLVCGMELALHSWEGMTFVDVGSFRYPAAQQGLRDFSGLKGASLATAASDQLFEHIQTEITSEGFEIVLPQFILRGPNGKKNFTCRVGGRLGVFDRVQVTLRGEGVSEHGRVPKIIAEAECASRDEGPVIGPVEIFVPMAEISQLPSKDQIYKSVELKDMISVWPTEWRLIKVQYFSGSHPEATMTLEPHGRGIISLTWE